MNAPTTMSVTEFKKHCLSVLSDIADHKLQSLVVTKHGKPIAQITPAKERKPFEYGCMKGTIKIAEGVDLSEVGIDEPFDAEQGILHR